MQYSKKSVRGIIKTVIESEIADINAMIPEQGENNVTFQVKQMHYKAECRALRNRLLGAIN